MTYKTVVREDGTLERVQLGVETLGSTKPLPVQPEMLNTLVTMPADDLKALLTRVLQAGWGYGSLTGKELVEMALKTKDEAYEALKLTALTLAVNASDWREFNALATFWSEREKGKALASLALELKDSRMDDLEVDKLVRLAGMLDDPVVIAPLPGKISQD